MVSGIYPPESGGPSKFAQTFSKWLTKEGLSCSVLAYSDSKRASENINGVTVDFISRKIFLPYRLFLMALAVRSAVRRGQRILANGCFLEVYFASLVYPFKYVVKIPGDIVWERATNSGVTDLSIDDFQNIPLSAKYRVFRNLYTKSIKRSSHVIVPSTHLQQMCISWGVPEEKISIIYNSVDTSIFHNEIPKTFDYDVITVTRLVPWKGVDELIRVCHALNLRLLIVGNGPEFSRLNALAESLTSKINFLGNVNQDFLPKLYSMAKYFVLNSSYEATSYSLIEARACGLIAIANAKTGSSEVIRDSYDGFLFGSSETPDLVYALKTAISVDFLEFSLRARSATMQHFDQEINFKVICKLVLEGC